MGRYRRRECIPGCVILFIELIRLQCDKQGIALIGGGMILIFQSIQTYVVDAFTLHAASGMHPYLHSYVLLNIYTLSFAALAAVAFLRSLAGFGFPLFAPAMYNSLGYGKGNTILAVVAIVLGCPA